MHLGLQPGIDITHCSLGVTLSGRSDQYIKLILV